MVKSIAGQVINIIDLEKEIEAEVRNSPPMRGRTLCIFLRWPNVPERESRLKLVWTQVAHWAAVIVAMNLVLLQGFQQLMPVQAAGLVLMLLLGLGTFLAGISLFSLRICFLGLAMALSIPAMTWLKQASLLLMLAGVAIAGLAVAFWPRGKKASA